MTAMFLVFEFHLIIQTNINKAKYYNNNNNKSSNRIRSPWTIEEDKDFNSFASSQRVIDQINSYMTVQGNDDDLIIITIIENSNSNNNGSTNIIDDGTSVDTEPVLSNDDENEEKEEHDDDDDDAFDSTDNIQRLSLLRRR